MLTTTGTASWTDKSLLACGRFYPQGCTSAEERLRYYASQFQVVEVDSSYYALPSARNAELWAQRTPHEFRFNVKAFRLFTGHQTPQQALPRDIAAELQLHFSTRRNIYYKDMPVELRAALWARFEHAIRPLQKAGKLTAVHFQFPPWVLPGERAQAHLQECAGQLAGYRLAVEFRHQSWFDEKHRTETLAFARDNGFVHVIVDAPQDVTNSVPAVWEVTNTGLAIVRLHGRNAKTWNIKGAPSAAARFNYDYSQEELADLAGRIHQFARQVDLFEVIFNNNYEDQGQRNARSLLEMLDGSG